jgi:membrane protease subunit HflK
MEIEVGNQRIEIPEVNYRAIGGGIIGFVILAALLTSFYTIKTEEQGIVLRFGKHIKTVEPGLHFRMPYGIDKVQRVAVKRQMKQEFGFGTEDNSNRSQWTSPAEMEEEKQMVSGDLNAALVEWVIQYRIDKPTEYLFNVRNADDTLRDASESVMREVVGDRTVDEVITVGRQEIESECLLQLQELVNKYEMGISIDQVQLKNVNPPLPVQASFNEVNQAQQEREKSINVAHGDYNMVVPRASGEADRMLREAEGYATKRINEAEGDVARFNAVFAEYQKAPEVTKRRIYLETLKEVMPALERKIVIDEDAKSILPMLQLGSENSK